MSDTLKTPPNRRRAKRIKTVAVRLTNPELRALKQEFSTTENGNWSDFVRERMLGKEAA